MISKFIEISSNNNDDKPVTEQLGQRSLYLSYPCASTTECAPYELKLKPAVYKFECWGAKGQTYYGEELKSTPGLGGYTRGTIYISKDTTLYVFIGATGVFNSVHPSVNSGITGGGATDVRLNRTNEWYDLESLKSRVMVAAGGGGSEWPLSIGGNGGGLNGMESTSEKEFPVIFDEKCPGATQTTGDTGECPTYNGVPPKYGTFGYAVKPTVLGTIDNSMGGLGGGGYYGGTSYAFAYAGSGGSSYISGHKGCNSIENTEDDEIKHTGDSVHFSNFVFSDTEMIPGNQTMPLPNTQNDGIWENDHGAFRITLIHFQNFFICERRRNIIQFAVVLFIPQVLSFN